jgi:hypothetical protein
VDHRFLWSAQAAQQPGFGRAKIISSGKIMKPLTLLFAAALVANGQTHDHHEMVNQHGDEVMGFSHEKTTHHFRLYPDGGAIEVQANDPADSTTCDQIRLHLEHISGMFANGNFEAPMLIHSQVPAGVPAMKRLRQEIRYKFEKTATGGLVRITTRNAEARAAVYEFLRFQITDHQTGDPKDVVER